MHDVRREEADRHEAEADDAESTRDPGKPDHARNDGRRGEHDADLEGRRREFVVVVARQPGLAVLLRLARLLHQLLAAVAPRLVVAARGLLAPDLDLLR